MRTALLTLLATACAPLSPGADEEPSFRADVELDLPIPDDTDFVPGRLIVGFHGPADEAALPLPQAPDLGVLTRLRSWPELDVRSTRSPTMPTSSTQWSECGTRAPTSTSSRTIDATPW